MIKIKDKMKNEFKEVNLPLLYFLKERGVRAEDRGGRGFGVSGLTWTNLSELAGPAARENTGIGDCSLIS